MSKSNFNTLRFKYCKKHNLEFFSEFLVKSRLHKEAINLWSQVFYLTVKWSYLTGRNQYVRVNKWLLLLQSTVTSKCSSRTNLRAYSFPCGRHSGLMVSALISRSSGPGSSPGRGHCVVFLGKTLSQCLSPPRSINGYR